MPAVAVFRRPANVDGVGIRLRQPGAQGLAGRDLPKEEDGLRTQGPRRPRIAQDGVVGRDHRPPARAAKAQRRERIREDGPAQLLRPENRLHLLAPPRTADDHARRSRKIAIKHLFAGMRLGRHRGQGEKTLPIDRLRQALRRAIGHRGQGITEGRIEVHRPGGPRPLDRVPQRLAEVLQQLHPRLGHRQFVEKPDETAEELLLVHRLARSAVAQLRRAVGGDRDQGRAALLRLDQGRQVVRPRRTTGAEQDHRHAGALGQAEPENPAERSSSTATVSIAGCATSASVNGVLREPGEITACRTPDRASVSAATEHHSEFVVRKSRFIFSNHCPRITRNHTKNKNLRISGLGFVS